MNTGSYHGLVAADAESCRSWIVRPPPCFAPATMSVDPSGLRPRQWLQWTCA